MSYARFSDGDVYLIATFGGWECVGCRLAPEVESIFPGLPLPGTTKLRKLKTVYRHLQKHKKHGHQVPDYCLSRVRQEIASN